MVGLEYLDADLLRRLWLELAETAARHAEQLPGGGAELLHAINPLWHLLGRVTFHLAENKQSADHPFAFLATYTHRISAQSRLAHLPLAEALRRYASAADRGQLDSLLEPVRRAAERSEVVGELLGSKALFSPQAWTIRQAHRFLTQIPQIEDAGVVVRVPDWWSARRPSRPQVQVQIGQRPASQVGVDSLLDFHVSLALAGQSLTDEERRRLLASDEGLILLRGKWVEVDRQRLLEALDHWQALASQRPDGISFIEGMRLLAGAPIGADSAAEDRTADWSQITAGDWLRQTLQRLRSPQDDARCQPGRDLRATLRPYQVEGVNWLWFLSELGLGACLADDMGLGKTIQIIDLLLQRKRAAGRAGGPASLLVVPASLLGNWRAELARFAPTLRPAYLHRSECSAEDLERFTRNPAKELADYDLVATTYGLARRQEWLGGVSWGLVVLDEAQAIKNASSAQARSVKRLRGRSRIVLTGTPVENHLGDLWSLFDFCSPGLLGTGTQFKQFVKRLNKQQDAQAFGALRRLVRPYILRRLKTDPGVAPDLPAKTEMRAECGLSKKQAVLYERAVAGLAERLKSADGMARRGLVLSVLMQLKQICNHPAQYLKSDAFEPADSGKFERLRLLCEPVFERQEKALVFTQFQSLTRPLAEFLADVFGRPGLVLDGDTPVRRRTELVRTFQDPPGPPFFVISLKAGGSGLNLTAASHVIHFDRWWNPAVENQATDRAFRIGQRRNVLVHKFVCRGTVEERIDAMIESKQGVADRLLDQGPEQQLTELGDDELLRFVALDIHRAAAE
jgi:non-specific serine/threonine protein kinase